MIIYIDTQWDFDRETFAADVRKARLEHGLTQRDVDTMIGRESTTSNVENWREDYYPQVMTVLLLCNLFDLDPRHYWTTT